MGRRMNTLGRNHIWASPHPFHLIRYLSPFWMASNLGVSFMQSDKIPQYWRALWLSHGTACALPSPVHLAVTSSNLTLVLNSLLTASSTCTDSPHSSTLLATYCLLHWDNWYALDASIPAMTSLWILNSFHDCLCHIRNSNFEIFQPTSLAAVACALLRSWNRVLALPLLPLHPPSWRCNYALDSTMQLF